MIKDLPQNWEITELDNVCEILDSMRIPINTKERNQRIEGKSQDQLYPYYGATGKVGVIDDFIFEGEYVLLGEDGAPFLDSSRDTAYIVNGKFWVNNHAHILKAYSSNKFLCHYLNQVDYSEYVTGTTRLKLNQARLKEIIIKFPPLNEQKRIVGKIEELFSELDKGIESLKTAREQLKVYRQAVLKHAFEGKLTADWREKNKAKLGISDELLEIAKENGKNNSSFNPREKADLPEIPSQWLYTRLANVGDLGRGKSKHRPRNDKKLFGGEYPFLQTGEVKAANRIIKEYTKTYNDIGLQQSKLWPEGTLCITIAANIAETAFLGFDACFPDSVVGFTAHKRLVLSEYVELFIRSVRTRIEAYAPATAQKNINLTTLENLVIPICSLDEQKQMVAQLEAIFSIVDDNEKEIDAQLKKTEALRQSILKQAFSGKLVEQNPNDEPAFVLLERIKAEKDTSKKKRNAA